MVLKLLSTVYQIVPRKHPASIMIPCVKLNYLRQKSLVSYMFVVNIWQRAGVVFLAMNPPHVLHPRAQLTHPS